MRRSLRAVTLAWFFLLVTALPPDVRAAQCGLVDGVTDGSTEHDTDGDGLPDCLDACPVLANAPTDTDEDGIPDACDCDIEVDSLADEKDGECEVDCTLRDAVALAAPGCTVRLPAGVLELSSPLGLDRSVSLIGAGADSTDLHHAGAGFAVRIGHASQPVKVYLGALAIEHAEGGLELSAAGLTQVVLSNVRVEGDGGSGAHLSSASNAVPGHTLDAGQSVIRSNATGVRVGGGGTSAPHNVFTCRHCLIAENEDDGVLIEGGFSAPAAGKGGKATLLDSTVHLNGDNGAQVRGAVNLGNTGGILTAERTLFSHNTGAGIEAGGGFTFGGGGSASLTWCEVAYNGVGLLAAGGVEAGGGSVGLTRSALHENQESGVVVGAAFCSTNCNSTGSGSFTAQSSTITNNGTHGIQLDGPPNLQNPPATDPSANLNQSTVTGNQTGVSVWDDNPQFTGTLTLNRSVIASNGADCDGKATSTGFNLLGSAAGCTINAQPTDLIGAGNPALLPFGDYSGPTPSAPPDLGSALVDAGGTCTGTDQRDIPRPYGPACDIGAAEYAELVRLDRTTYGCEDVAHVTVLDVATGKSGSQEITARSSSEPAGEQVTLPGGIL